MSKTITQFHAGRNGSMARPNIRYRDLEARRNTDAYLAEVERKAAGTDDDRPKIAWWRKLKVYELALLVLGAIGLIVMAWR